MKQPLKISSQKLPWALLGIMIIIASFLQVITYYSYNKLDNAVQTFIADIREAKDDKEAEEIFVRFIGDSAPLIGQSESSAGFFGKIKNKIFGGGSSGGCSQETVEVLKQSGASTETIGKICL